MIEGIFFSEFDNNAGPVIRYQDPEGYETIKYKDIQQIN